MSIEQPQTLHLNQFKRSPMVEHHHMIWPGEGETILFVARQEGEFLGTITVRDPQHPNWEIERVWVDLQHRRHGHGKMLVRCVETLAREQQKDGLYLHIAKANAEAESFYRSVGFVPSLMASDGGRYWTKALR